MNYSWKNANNLDQAQIDKMELIAKKLMLKPGMRVLDIGMGYGRIAKYLCEKYGVTVVGYTLSKEMAKEAAKRCHGLDVQVFCKDYRDVTGKFDRIFSLEMIEHVGPKNLTTYFEIANKCLVDEGIFLLQATVVNVGKELISANPAVHKFIFVNCSAPRLEEIFETTKGLFVIVDLHNFGYDGYHTIKAFEENFVKNWHTISNT